MYGTGWAPTTRGHQLNLIILDLNKNKYIV